MRAGGSARLPDRERKPQNPFPEKSDFNSVTSTELRQFVRQASVTACTHNEAAGGYRVGNPTNNPVYPEVT